jgi:uncharacterized surface protein with fasciclin (FAS1) repeats
MNRILRISSGFFLMLLFLTGCVKKEFKEFYARPDNLAQPIYQQLTARKNFTNLLACIDKAGYKDILSKAGYWTFFAPNDAAFQKYFTENSISGIAGIDSATAKKIVTYSLVFNAFRKDQLSNYQSTTGVIPNQAFKRKTTYYDFVQTEIGQTRKIVSSNRNGLYVANDNNNKSIPYFTDNFLTAKGLSVSDYNSFYPNTTYSGFNVADASVVNADIVAENGLIHETDKVILPLPSIEQYIASKPEYDEFRNLLNKMATYVVNADLTHRYQVLTGSADSVFVKMYRNTLGFSPNNENYLTGGTDSQIGGYSFIAPTNQEVINYTQSLLANFGTFEAAPPEVLNDFINAHMWTSLVWPNKFAVSVNFQGEIPTMATANIIDTKLLSNGIFYGTNKVQEANVFRTIYSKPYLDPRYILMTRGLNAELKYSIINSQVKYTMFMMPDISIRAAYYDWSFERNSWSYSVPLLTVDYSTNARDRFYRILQTSVTQPTINLTDLSGQGIVEMYNGEYIKYDNYKIYASGNIDAGNYLLVDSSKTLINGTVYYTHEEVPPTKLSTGGLLTFTEKGIGAHINALALADAANFGYFNSYLINSAIWNAATFSIVGTTAGSFYTIFIPTNAAISTAVIQGLLPGNTTTGVPTFNSAVAADKEKVIRFLTYHILNKTTVATDGVKSGAYATLLQNAAGDPTFVTVINQVGNMELRDAFNRSALVVLAKSNNLSNRTVIHSINNFLKYNY